MRLSDVILRLHLGNLLVIQIRIKLEGGKRSRLIILLELVQVLHQLRVHLFIELWQSLCYSLLSVVLPGCGLIPSLLSEDYRVGPLNKCVHYLPAVELQCLHVIFVVNQLVEVAKELFVFSRVKLLVRELGYLLLVELEIVIALYLRYICDLASKLGRG
jgi:hypothetical protein